MKVLNRVSYLDIVCAHTVNYAKEPNVRNIYNRLVLIGLVVIGGLWGSELNADQFSDPIEKEQTVFRRFETERFDQEPILSPDGSQIAFIHVQGRDILRRRLWIMDRDGGNARPLTNDPEPHFEAYPRWSPDGRYISYTSNLGGDNNTSSDPRSGRHAGSRPELA